ncbi:hypothetical protein E4P42_04870 [Mycobacterium sp. PS03-16]|uniref:hypothetical protein n=1 Tax=Mycobacterium sp. PS03-16 TaxID=2559611 RepID=UPI0010738B54|nr:hypothetical protein [Mycobacterium sp. PS03-16]TFV60280.1 hypothetical protein E4P42_04870 [Mycobacterium sp. PS03-16]
MTTKWDVVVIEPTDPGITKPSDEELQATTIDGADEADARQIYADRLRATENRPHTAVQLRCEGRIIEHWPPR